MLGFSWDPEKERANRNKHGISFVEAATVFCDELAVQFFDEEHSNGEDRFIMLGMSNRFRILVVIHCEERDGHTLRIISARRATFRERRHYRKSMQ